MRKDHLPFLIDGCRRYGLPETTGILIADKVDRAEEEGLSIRQIVDQACRLGGLAEHREALGRLIHFAIMARYRSTRLADYRDMGLRQVRIVPVEDARTCDVALRLAAPFDIDKVPGLPLAGCDAEVCRCGYIAEFD